MAKNVLNIKDLYVSFDTYAGEVQAVRGVSYHVDEGEVLGVVGESGCGKSVTAQTIMKLNPMPPAKIKSGEITLDGIDIIATSEDKMQEIRGKEVSMIFQDPMTCLNPTMKVGRQITEAIKHHQKLSKEEAEKRSIEMLKLVQIPNPEERAQQYPHEFSGGMRQRAMIAMALSCNPKLLIADEPTTALDVTIQAQIIDLLGDIRKKTGTAIILITHDLGVVASLVDRVAVMYAGKIVETAKVNDIFKNAAHPYTKALLSSLPSHDTSKEDKLTSIPGTPPDLIKPPVGCGFASRCEKCMKICKAKQPPVFDLGDGHSASCWLLHKDCPQGGNK
ncbi:MULTISPECIES: ABC transporter ATP-binding protein [unclassified Thomasclavelia]|uniref:ABC transporter ATP-binding protein n=1 Tax=Candidatus Erysipelatoclostridium merdavium TaxID=2838566 RepID=A0A9D1XJH6_9FIRM|nr:MULTISPECIES: ABC transporter ATP-binding protein [unclassified Thomasclavelia]OUP78374.1 peptide ABC transporter ATP-binding protein [Erysipelatoclostridium sp. An173]OUQ08680.1 peptide ABC transporter ATP-binding protein [Erysipelatoclostridium sp. An15]HIX80673.1 ABC transporter ATP-binding protein [Candidatus Erysipelatoclostridium merdavium]